MSITVEVLEDIYLLEVESAIAENSTTLQIEVSTNNSLEISSGYTGSIVFARDIIGLDTYLANFIDEYNIDCGSP